MLQFKAAASFVHSRANTAVQPRIIHLWRWRNLVMQHSSFRMVPEPLGSTFPDFTQTKGWSAYFCLIKQAALPKPLKTGITKSSKHSQYCKHVNTNGTFSTRTKTTQGQGWLASVCPARTSRGTLHPPSCSCRNLDLALRAWTQRPSPQSIFERAITISIVMPALNQIPLCLTAITRRMKQTLGMDWVKWQGRIWSQIAKLNFLALNNLSAILQCSDKTLNAGWKHSGFGKSLSNCYEKSGLHGQRKQGKGSGWNFPSLGQCSQQLL